MQRSNLSFRELEPQDVELIKVAKAVLQRMYRAGRHTVGAAILCSSKRIYSGINAEKCIYDACAESRAMTAAFGQGDREVLAIVTVGKLGDEYAVLRPCEECLQLLIRCSPEAMVIVSHDGKIMKTKIQYLGANSRMNALVEQSGQN